MSVPAPGREDGVVEGLGGPGKGPWREWTACPLSPSLLSALQLLLWHSALWMVQEATPLGLASSLPQSFLLKCLEQVRKVQADGAALQERLVSERPGGDTDAGAGRWKKDQRGKLHGGRGRS